MINYKLLRTIQVAFLFLFLFSFYQNCDGDLKFESIVGSNSNEDFGTLNPADSVSQEFDDSDLPPEISIPSLESETGNEGVQNTNGSIFDTSGGGEVTFKACKEFYPLQPVAGVVELPIRTADSDTCHYIKILNSIIKHDSGSYGESRTNNVLANNHDGPGSKRPYSIVDKNYTINWSGKWKLALSGVHDDPNAKMAIDNFFLLELKSENREAIWAFGTKDSQPIMVNEEALENFKSYADYGTASVGAINILDIESNNKASLDLRFRALDCGGSAYASDVYMVFY